MLALLVPGPSYGYQLAQALERAGLGPIQGGTLYPVLLRLQRAGLVTWQWQGGESGPARKYYTLTAEGRAVLRNQGTTWLAFADRVRQVLREGGVE